MAGGERRVRRAGPFAFDVPDRDRTAGLDRVRGCPAGGGGTRVEQVVGQFSARRADDELVVLEETDDGGVGPEQSRRLSNDLVEDRRRIELRSEQRARARKLLRQPPCTALALVELAPL